MKEINKLEEVIYSDLDKNLVSKQKEIKIDNTSLFQEYGTSNAKSFALSCVRFLNFSLSDLNPQYFTTLKTYVSTYDGCVGGSWEINKLLKGKFKEIEYIKTKEKGKSINEVISEFNRLRITIASINPDFNLWYTSYKLIIGKNSSDAEKEKLLLWDKIRKRYIPSDPNFPIEEAYWLNNIEEIRKEMWEKKGLGNRGYR